MVIVDDHMIYQNNQRDKATGVHNTTSVYYYKNPSLYIQKLVKQ